MSEFGFDDEGTTYGLHDLDIDWAGGSRQDYDRTGGRAFEKRDLYDQSLEGRLMMEVRKDIGTYGFSKVRADRIEEAIRRHDVALKQSYAPLTVAATIFLDMYESRGGLNAKNFAAFEKSRRKNIKKLDLIRYIRYLQTLEVEVDVKM